MGMKPRVAKICPTCKEEKHRVILCSSCYGKERDELDGLRSDSKLSIVIGVEGPSVYLNNYRIAGSKPWGGGKIAGEWTVSGEDLATALKERR